MAVITIYDIARMAGVSPATVSRVLTKSTKVSDKKRILVEKLIDKYKFSPNAIARGLITGTKVIGVMTADIRNPYYAALAVECEVAAAAMGYTVMLCNNLDGSSMDDAHLNKLFGQRVEAIIQLGRQTDDLVPDPAYVEHVKYISQTIPFITNGKLEGVNYYSIGSDHFESVKIVMDYLISLGHKDIAFIVGADDARGTIMKSQAYMELLKEYGLAFRKGYIQNASRYDLEDGYKCMKRLLALKHRPTAVITINDLIATGAMPVIFDNGLSIPDDISVVSYDNSFLTTISRPNLTSVDYNYVEQGKKLIETAILASQNKNPPKECLITPVLVIRDSCARPRFAAKK